MMHRIVRQLKGKPFITRRVRFTAEQIEAYNNVFNQEVGGGKEGNRDHEAQDRERDGSGQAVPGV